MLVVPKYFELNWHFKRNRKYKCFVVVLISFILNFFWSDKSESEFRKQISKMSDYDINYEIEIIFCIV